jgi:hypothetical protein
MNETKCLLIFTVNLKRMEQEAVMTPFRVLGRVKRTRVSITGL